MEKKVYLSAQNRLDYDLTRSSWIGDYDDPNTFLDLFRSNNGNNRTGWKNARYDALMREANRQTDLARRARPAATGRTHPGPRRTADRSPLFLRRNHLL